MNIKCHKNVLASAISSVQRGVLSKTTLQALTGIMFKAENDTLTLTTNNLEIGIEYTITEEFEIIEPGSIILEARIISEVVRRLPDEMISFIEKENHVDIICQKTEFNLNLISVEEFPALPYVDKKNGFSISTDIFKNMIKETSFAAARESANPVLLGVCVKFGEKNLEMAALDGFRLACRVEELDFTDNLTFVIPAKTLEELNKITSDNIDIGIYFNDNNIMFEFDNCRLVSKQIYGEYFDYQKLLSVSPTTTMELEVAPLIESIERASLVITGDSVKTPIILDIRDKEVILSCETQVGKVSDVFDADINGDNIQIGFNHKYLLDALRACLFNTDRITMNFIDETSACVINSKEDTTFQYLILPVRIK